MMMAWTVTDVETVERQLHRLWETFIHCEADGKSIQYHTLSSLWKHTLIAARSPCQRLLGLFTDLNEVFVFNLMHGSIQYCLITDLALDDNPTSIAVSDQLVVIGGNSTLSQPVGHRSLATCSLKDGVIDYVTFYRSFDFNAVLRSTVPKPKLSVSSNLHPR